MEAESFFSRWSKRKQEAREQEMREREAEPPVATPVTAPASAETTPLPTLEDAARLTPDSDFKPFLARGVDEEVKRSAMKKLFADPRFNVMDGLDVYIDDYSKSDPIPPEMLAALNHAKALLDPLGHLENPLHALLKTSAEDDVPVAGEALAQPIERMEDQAPVSLPTSASASNTAPDQVPHDDPI